MIINKQNGVALVAGLVGAMVMTSTTPAKAADLNTGTGTQLVEPQFDPVSNSSNFTGYTKGGFNRDEQERLKNKCEWLDGKGVKFLLSNSSTDFIRDLYQDFIIQPVEANRAVNSKGSRRGKVAEVLVRNYT